MQRQRAYSKTIKIMEQHLSSHTEATSYFDDHSPSNSIRKLLSLPHVLLPTLNQTMEAQQNPVPLYNLLRYDAALVARSLEIQRKSHTRQPALPTTNSVQQRLLDTSSKTVKGLVLSTFHDRNGIYTCGSALAQEYLKEQWLTSLQCGFLARSLALQVDYHDPEEAYFAGLLHNIGQLIFHAEDSDEYLNSCVYKAPKNTSSNTDNNTLLALESRRFYINHCELGATVCKSWNLSKQLQDAIRFHHADSHQIADAHILTRIVNISRAITEGEFTRFNQCTDSVTSLLAMPRDHVAPIIESAIAQVSDVIRALAIPLSDNIVRQNLVPIHDNDCDHAPLQDAIKLNQLTREIHFCGILETVKGSLADANNEAEIQQEVQTAAATLFDTESVYFFDIDHAKNSIRGNNRIDSHCLTNELSIRIEKGRSILADALIHKQCVDTFEYSNDDISIVDQEILHQASSKYLVCFPLFLNEQPFSLVAFAVNENDLLRLPSNRKHVEYFSHAIAKSLLHVKNKCEQFDSVLNAERSLYQTKLKRMTHEVNNPLSIAQNHLHILSVSESMTQQQQESLHIVQEEISRASNLLKLQIDNSLSNKTTQHPVNINETLSDLLLIFEDGLPQDHSIDTERHLDKNLPPIHLDDTKLKQVLTNLIKNAFESLNNDGWICVKTHDNVIVNGRQFIEIQIADDGPGIPPNIIDQLFSPISSSKGTCHNGIGLSIVKELTDQLKGFVSYRRESDGITQFSVFFQRKTEI